MKYVLLIMTIIQIRSFLRIFKNIFTTSKNDIDEVNESMKNLEDKLGDREIANFFMIIFSILYGLFLSLYYIFAATNIGSLIFTIISGIMILSALRDVGKIIRWIDSRDGDLVKRKFKDRVWSVFYLSYIGYLVYFLAVNW